MNILVDRHHAGLLYSLQLLFESRLGATVYVPIGREWWDEGIWQFGAVFGDDRLAQQYLYDPAGHGWEEIEVGVWSTVDVEFPDRQILGVTLPAFRSMADWEVVMATVQENQAGFHRLAQEVGAQYALQVGNRGQQVSWDLDPVAIVSAEAPIQGRGLVYHQEYDKDSLFQFREPHDAAPLRISSFVNCFNRMPEQWRYFEEFEELLGWADCRVYGHDGRDGLIHPTSAIADKMRHSMFGYHDKPQGDGFGHVIHYWASIGRPLIGHASYYAGLMPEPFWEDGVTAISLDGKTPKEATQQVLAVTKEQYESMCREIRRRLDELVDFEAEASAIAKLFGWKNA